MGKFRLRAHLDQALLLLLIMAGALMTAVLEVRGALEVSAAGKSRHATAVAAPVPAPRGPVAVASATRSASAGTLLARLSYRASGPQHTSP